MVNSTNWTTVFWYEFVENIESLDNAGYRQLLFLIVRPVIFVLGVTGNVLSALVLSRKQRRKKSFSMYLITLALCDTGALMTRVLPWGNALRHVLGMPLVFVFRNDVSCALVEYLFTCVHVLCGWLVVAVAWERAVVLTWPLESKSLATSKKARRIILAQVVSVFAIFSYIPVFTSYRTGHGCVMPTNRKYLHYYVSTMFVTCLPFISITIANVWIIIRLRLSRNTFSKKERRNDVGDRRVTFMLLTVTVTFFMLLVPNALFVLITGVVPDWQPPVVVVDVANLCFDLNYAINFYLYVMIGRQLREELFNFFRCQ